MRFSVFESRRGESGQPLTRGSTLPGTPLILSFQLSPPAPDGTRRRHRTRGAAPQPPGQAVPGANAAQAQRAQRLRAASKWQFKGKKKKKATQYGVNRRSGPRSETKLHTSCFQLRGPPAAIYSPEPLGAFRARRGRLPQRGRGRGPT